MESHQSLQNNEPERRTGNGRALQVVLVSAIAATALAYQVGKDVERYETTGCPVDTSAPLHLAPGLIANAIGGAEEAQHPFRFCAERNP